MGMTRPSHRGLNAAAPAYVPLAVRGAVEVEALPQDMLLRAEEARPDGAPAPPHSLLDLPTEVLSSVLGNLSGPSALVAAMSCKQLRWELSMAPLSMDVGRKAANMLSSEAKDHMEAVARSLAKYTPGLTGLDMSGAPVDNDDVLGLLRRLPRLQSLCLSAGRRLTCSLAGSLVATAPRHLTTLDLQRCFQLNASALCDLLAASHTGALPALRCLAMSHLDLSGLQDKLRPRLAAASTDGPQHDTPTARQPTAHGDDGAPSGVGVLRLLALHNCSGLGAAGLACVASAAPRLHMLMLGGCTVAAPPPLASGGAELPDDGLASLADVRRVVDGAGDAHLPTRALPPRAAERAAAAAAALAYAALRLRHLRVLELTFAGPAVTEGVRCALAALAPLRTGADADADCAPAAPHLWDLTLDGGLHAACEALAVDRALAPHSGGQTTATTPLSAALKAAASCSSAARATPLHVAAYSVGGEPAVGRLLGLGAALDARDAGGATPLFLAAEAGRAPAVHALVAAGADARLSNAAGESPLYIAALKGHLGIVRCLVGYLVGRNVPWTQLTYPDGWTPLMAAVVAGHTHVVRWLITSAGTQDGGARSLLMASNRYGQSALHIAARKASPQLLRLLLGSGGGDVLRAADALGETPMDVAKKHAHAHAVEEFRRVQCALA